MLGALPATALTVLGVACASGAPVNYAETVRPGQHLLVPRDPAHPLRPGEDGLYRLDVPIDEDGRSYRSGRPPCPRGDRLLVEFGSPGV